MTHSLQQLLDIKLPIIQAPMAGVQDAHLAAAVSNAGGLGSLPCAMLNPDSLQRQLTELATLTDRPYNVNFFCHKSPSVDASAQDLWSRRLKPYRDELGLEQTDIASGPQRSPFNDTVADIIETFKPSVVSFHFGLPAAHLVDRVKQWGAIVLCTATTVAEAQWLQANGADVVIAQGLEAGGHRGNFLTDDMTTQLGTFALLPQVIDAVNIPVVAAGGIATPATVKAAIELGAAAVQIGTSFLLCDEAKTSPLHRAALQSDAAVHTALTNVFTGRYARGIVNRIMRDIGPDCSDAPAFPAAAAEITALRNEAEKRGSSDFTPLWSGQNASGCRSVPAAELTATLTALV